MKKSNCCKVEAPYNRKDGYFHCGKCNKPCTPIEEPTEEKCCCKGDLIKREGFTIQHSKTGCSSARSIDYSESPKDTCEEGWRCGKCDGGDFPMHSRHCSKRNEWEKLYFCEYDDIDDFKKAFDSVVRSLIAQKEATAREEERKRIVEIVEKSKEENLSHACKATNCSDPICGHSRCIDWMYTDLLLALKTN